MSTDIEVLKSNSTGKSLKAMNPRNESVDTMPPVLSRMSAGMGVMP